MDIIMNVHKNFFFHELNAHTGFVAETDKKIRLCSLTIKQSQFSGKTFTETYANFGGSSICIEENT